MKIDKIKQTADAIVKILENRNFNDVTDSSGYFTIDKKRFVDIFKSNEGGMPRYIVFCLYEDGMCELKNTDTLSVDELKNVLQEVYNS